ncbi:MAG TPA: efflux RND transporter periplasmic adaptor subunit [Thermodesulfobacteriota bacterium]
MAIRKTSWRVAAALSGLVVMLAGGPAAYRAWLVEAAPAPRTVTVVLGDVERTVTALGKIEPRDYVDVGTQVSGQLRRLHVDIGDEVTKGQLLAEIDPTVYETRVRASRARLADLKAQLAQRQAERDLARAQAARNRQLFAEGIISRDTVETAESAYRVADGRIASLEAQIEEAEATLRGDLANLGYTRIHAPMSGTVVAREAVEGQTVNASQTAPTIVRIADLSTVTVRAQVAEADVVKLATGIPAYFTTLGMPERRWETRVRQILPTPETVNDVVLYNVLLDVPNEDGLLASDMTAQVFFLLEAARDVPVVPMEALTRTADGYQVQVLSGNTVVTRPVEVGVTSRTAAAVASGLAVGDQVVVGDAPARAAWAPPGRARLRGSVL